MPRRRIHPDNAARQAAYRDRIFKAYRISEWKLRSVRQLKRLATFCGREDMLREIEEGRLTMRKAFGRLRDLAAAKIIADDATHDEDSRGFFP